jgi:hypothetical protein
MSGKINGANPLKQIGPKAAKKDSVTTSGYLIIEGKERQPRIK